MSELVALTLLVLFAATAVAAMLAAEYAPLYRTGHTPRHAAVGLSTSQRLTALAEQARRLVDADRVQPPAEETERIVSPISPWTTADGLDEWVSPPSQVERQELLVAA